MRCLPVRPVATAARVDELGTRDPTGPFSLPEPGKKEKKRDAHSNAISASSFWLVDFHFYFRFRLHLLNLHERWKIIYEPVVNPFVYARHPFPRPASMTGLRQQAPPPRVAPSAKSPSL